MSYRCPHCNLMQSSTESYVKKPHKMKYADLKHKVDKTIDEIKKHNLTTAKLNNNLQKQTDLLQTQRNLVVVETEKYASIEKQLNISKMKFKHEQTIQSGQLLRSNEIETHIDIVQKRIKFRNESMVIENLMKRYQTEIKGLNNVKEVEIVQSKE